MRSNTDTWLRCGLGRRLTPTIDKCEQKKQNLIIFGSSWNRVGDFGAEGLTKLCISRVFCITAGLGFGINSGWHEQRSAGGDFGIRIGSPGFDRNRQCTAFLVIRKHA